MDPTLLLHRWAHILAAIVAMGGLVFARFALVPALSDIDATTRDRIHDAIRRRWLPWVIGAITVLLASGLINFLLFNGRVKAEGWADGSWMRQTTPCSERSFSWRWSSFILPVRSSAAGKARSGCGTTVPSGSPSHWGCCWRSCCSQAGCGSFTRGRI